MEAFGNFFRKVEKQQSTHKENLSVQVCFMLRHFVRTDGAEWLDFQVMSLVEEVTDGRDFEGTLDEEIMAILKVGGCCSSSCFSPGLLLLLLLLLLPLVLRQGDFFLSFSLTLFLLLFVAGSGCCTVRRVSGS